MALLIRKPAEQRFVKACVFAPAGAGKTVFLGSAELDERTSPCLGIDFEGGTESLSGLDIDIAPVGSWDDFNEAYELLLSGKYKSTFIDSISEVHKFALLDILRKQGPSRKDPDLLEQRDYGTATVQMRRLLREFRDLPMHVFFSAHAKEVEIPREGRVRLPDLAGQMAEEISGIVSVQGYLAQFEEDGELHRTILLHSFPKFRIKARTPWGVEAPPEIIDPTVTELMDALGYGTQEEYSAKYPGSSRGRQIDDDLSEEETVEEKAERLIAEENAKAPDSDGDAKDNEEKTELDAALNPDEDEDGNAEDPDAVAPEEEDPEVEPEPEDGAGDFDAGRNGHDIAAVKAMRIGELRTYASEYIEGAKALTRGKILRELGVM